MILAAFAALNAIVSGAHQHMPAQRHHGRRPRRKHANTHPWHHK